MRTMYQASPWKAANGPFFRSSAFDRHMPERLGDPGAYFSGERFLPTRSGGTVTLGRPLVLPDQRFIQAPPDMAGLGEREGVDVTRPICRCEFAKHGANLGQACSAPTAGGSGSAEFGAGDAAPSAGPKMETILVAGAVGVGVLLLLGIL